MKVARTGTVLLAFSGLLSGCAHKPKATPPSAAQAPALPVSTLARDTPPPDMPPPKLPQIGPPNATSVASHPNPKPQKPGRRKLRHMTIEASGSEQTAQTAAPPPKGPQPTEQASSAELGEISPIGQLSAAGESMNTPRRNQILDDINSTEKGLNEIKRPLTEEEQTTAAQIRTFLTKARDSIKQEDLDGAHTLVTKAKVLLAELTNP